MNPASALARWVAGVNSQESTLAVKIRKLEHHVANPPKSPDPAEHRTWLSTRRELEEDIAAERAALAIAKEEKAKAEKAAGEAAIDAQGKEAERAAREAAKLTPEIDDDARRLKTKLERLAELKAIVDRFNKARGLRPFIEDGEHRVRAVPDRVEPAKFEERDVWKDAWGRSPAVFHKMANGDLVPRDQGFLKTRQRVEVQPEKVIRGGIPGKRFADAFQLIGLKGEALFPSR